MKAELSESWKAQGAGPMGTPGPLFRSESEGIWRLPAQELDLSGPVVMGILNLTPDSFSDGGELSSLGLAMERAQAMVEAGAGILDVGGESTRPGAAAVHPEEELSRILPFLEAARGRLGVPLSVDTRQASVARGALAAGAQIVNDVSALKHDPEMAEAVVEGNAALVLSHMRGTPATMRQWAMYRDVVREVREELRGSLTQAVAAGIPVQSIVVDPGIGFAKTGAQSLRLLGEIGALAELGRPILVGPSRKSFIGEITGRPPEERGPGTLAACVLAFRSGARIFRVHEVAEAVQALAVARAILSAEEAREKE